MKYLLWQAVPGFIWFLVISSKICPERLASGILNDRVLWFEMIPGLFSRLIPVNDGAVRPGSFFLIKYVLAI